MKSKLLISLLALVLISGAYLICLRPHQMDDGGTENDGGGGKAKERSIHHLANAAPDATRGDELRKNQERTQQTLIFKRLLIREKKKAERKMSQLETLLALSPEQMEVLKGYYEKNALIFSKLDVGLDIQKMSDELAKEIATFFTEADLVDYLAEHLDEEQQEALETHQKEQKKSSVDNAALKELGNIIGEISLSGEQRQEIYDIFVLIEEVSQEDFSDKRIIRSRIKSSFGVGGAMTEDMNEVIDELENLKKQNIEAEEIITIMKDRRAVRIGLQVEQLRGVLDETQAEAYRSHLKGEFPMFDMMVEMMAKEE